MHWKLIVLKLETEQNKTSMFSRKGFYGHYVKDREENACCLAINLRAEYVRMGWKHPIFRGPQWYLGIRHKYSNLSGNFPKSCFKRGSSGGKTGLRNEGGAWKLNSRPSHFQVVCFLFGLSFSCMRPQYSRVDGHQETNLSWAA